MTTPNTPAEKEQLLTRQDVDRMMEGVKPSPLAPWERRMLDGLVAKLTRWRADDHHDAIVLQRGEVIMLLEGLKRGHIR